MSNPFPRLHFVRPMMGLVGLVLVLAAMPPASAFATPVSPPQVVTASLATVALRGTAETATTTTTSLTIAKPTGVVSGDLLIANFVQAGSSSAPTPPTGWSTINGTNLGGSNPKPYAAVYYRVADGSEGTTFTFAVAGGGATASGVIVAFSGVNSISPFDVAPGTILVGNNTTVTATTVTTVSANAVIVMLGQAGNSAPTWSVWNTTSPGALTELYDFQGGATGTTTSLGAAWAVKPTAGATGNGTATLSGGGDRNGGILLALKPKLDPTLSVTNSPVTYNGSPQAATVIGSVAGTVSNVQYNNSTTVPTSAGSYAITADFTPTGPGAGAYNSLSGASAGNFVINKATPTLSVTNSPVTYNGSAQAAILSSSALGTLSNVRYNGSATVPTAASTYAVTADFAPTDPANYNSLTGASAGNFIIDKATPTLSVTNSPVTYDNTAHAAAVSASVSGSVGNILTGGAATQTNAGTYIVTADFTPTDTTNYNSLTAASAGNFVINKANPILSVTNSPVTFDSSAHAAAVNGSVAGTPSNILMGGAATQTNAGTYAVTADFAPTDTTNYNSLTAASAGDFVINKATPTISVTNSPVTYNASPQGAAFSGSVPGTISNVQYNSSPTIPTDAATYVVIADFAPSDATNYNSLTAASAGNFVIEKATPTLSVTNSPATYNGSAQAAILSSSTAGATTNVQYGGFTIVPTNAGTYAMTADFAPTDITNYNSLTAASAGNFVINKANPILSVTNSPVTYDGLPHGASVSASVSGTTSNILTDGAASQINAGSYPVTADFAPTDTTNYNALLGASAGTFVIDKADPILSVTNSPVTYNGSPQAASVIGSVAGTASNLRYNGSATTPTNAGSYAVTADFASDNPNYSNLTGASAGSFVINKATPTISVANSPVTYNGSPQSATVNGSVAGNASNILTGGAAAQTNVGTYAVTADFAPTDSTNYNSLTGAPAGNFVINKATPTLSVTNSPVTYNGSPQPATVNGSVGGTVSSVRYDGSATAPTAAGSYAVTADFAPSDPANYNSLSGAAAGNFVINKATPTLSVTNSPVGYDGSPHAATVSSPVSGSVSNVLTGGALSQTNAGTYAVTADFAPTDTTNYNSLTGASAGNFVINQATPTISVTNSPVTYNGSPQPATVGGSVSGTASNVRYNGSSTIPTNAGTYAITADFTPDSSNYNSLSGASAGNFVIDKATPTLSVTNSPVTYNGSPRAATVGGSVPGTPSNILTGGAATQTNVGTYGVTADFAPTDTTNYNSLSAASAGNFVINKATPTISVSNSPVPYNGSPQAAVVLGSVPGTPGNIRYNGSATVPTNAGTYAVTADFAPTDATNYNSLTAASAGDFTIAKATPTLSVINSPVIYDGLPHSASVSASVGGTISNILTGGAATQTAAGTYAVTADFVPTDAANYNSLTGASAGNFVIGTATPTLSVGNSPVTYNGSPQPATVNSSVPGTVTNVRYNGSATVPINAGTYAITADFAPTDPGTYSSLTNASAGDFVINKATPTLSVINSPVTHNNLSQTATITGSVAGTASNILYNGSATAPTNAGSYTVTADFVPTDSTNYNSLVGAMAGSLVVSKATPTLSVTNPSVAYNGSPQTATVAGSETGTISNVRYNGSATVPTNAGTYAITADFAPTDTGNHNSLTGAAAGNFVIAKASQTITVTKHAPATAVNGTSFTVAATGGGSGNAVTYSAAGSCTNVGATFTMTSNSGTCTVRYDQAGNANYNAAPQVAETVNGSNQNLFMPLLRK